VQILFITDYPPYPPISGDLIRVYNLILRLAKQHQVSLAVLLWTPDEADSLSHLREFCHRVETVSLRWRHPLVHLPGLIHYALLGKPLELRLLYSEKLESKIRQLVSTEEFDIVHIEQSRMALYLEALPPGARCARILAFQNIAADQYARLFRVERSLITRARHLLFSLMMRRWEPLYAERFDSCITVSEVERSLLMAANPRLRVNVVPNGVDTRMYQPLALEERRPALLFIGSMSYGPCVDAAIYFCNQILPRIRQAVSCVELWIVGAGPTPEVSALSSDVVHVTGRVDSVLPYYKKSAISVVPLRAGGGTRLKILESMALGRPVVSTSIGCEGIDAIDSEHLLVADSPEQFSMQVIRLLTDRRLYESISTNARRLVVDRYDWDIIASQLLDVYQETLL
jgi:sugar transferase (PEP-CTERM/EpsH1 system associated)